MFLPDRKTSRAGKRHKAGPAFARYYRPSAVPTLYLLILLNVLTHSVYVGSRVLLVLYAIQLGAPTYAVGLLAAVYGIIPMLFSVWAGRLTDRLPPRKLMFFGALATTVGVALPAAIPEVWVLYVTGTLIGAGFMLYHLTMQNVSGYLGKPEDRTANFSLVSLGFSLSALIGPLFAGFAIDGLGHRVTFALFAIPPLVPVLIFAFNKLKLPSPPRAKDAASGGRVRDLLGIAVLRRLLIINGLIAVAWDLYAFVIPVHGASIGLSATVIGLVMGCLSAATFVVRIALPAISRRFNSWQVLSSVLLIAGALYCLFPIYPSALWLGFLSVLLGLVLGMTQPLVMALVHNHTPTGRAGTAVGLRGVIINSSQTFMPILFGAVGSIMGMAPVFFVVAAVLMGFGWSERRTNAREHRKN